MNTEMPDFPSRDPVPDLSRPRSYATRRVFIALFLSACAFGLLLLLPLLFLAASLTAGGPQGSLYVLTILATVSAIALLVTCVVILLKNASGPVKPYIALGGKTILALLLMVAASAAAVMFVATTCFNY